MKDILNPWVVGGALVIASLLTLISFLATGWFTPPPQLIYQGGGAITVIPVPTATRTPLPSPTLIPQASPTPENPSGILVGSTVQISGTGGDGLRLRRDPGLTGEIVYLGLEGEIFNVIGGPQHSDGYLWWQLEAPLNQTRRGWAVSNFLALAQSP